MPNSACSLVEVFTKGDQKRKVYHDGGWCTGNWRIMSANFEVGFLCLQGHHADWNAAKFLKVLHLIACCLLVLWFYKLSSNRLYVFSHLHSQNQSVLHQQRRIDLNCHLMIWSCFYRTPSYDTWIFNRLIVAEIAFKLSPFFYYHTPNSHKLQSKTTLILLPHIHSVFVLHFFQNNSSWSGLVWIWCHRHPSRKECWNWCNDIWRVTPTSRFIRVTAAAVTTRCPSANSDGRWWGKAKHI